MLMFHASVAAADAFAITMIAAAILFMMFRATTCYLIFSPLLLLRRELLLSPLR